jgi:hypothetical protein
MLTSMVPRPIRAAAFCIAAVFVFGCPSEQPENAQVSDDPSLQLKFETARRVLADIKASKLRGSNIYAECKTAKMLFVKDMKRLESPAAKRLAVDLLKVCEKATPP